MRTERDRNITDRRSLLLNGITLAGAAAMSQLLRVVDIQPNTSSISGPLR